MKRRKIWLLAAVLSAALSMTACKEADPEDSREMMQASMSEETAPDEAEEIPGEEAGDTDSERKHPADPEELAGQLWDTDFSPVDLETYTDRAYVVVNDNQPYFSEYDLTGQSFEFYSELDELGRCGTACARIGVDLMPTEKRESISQVRPTGWLNEAYDHVDGKYLYNRCHLIGFQLSGENANEKNLITGTRYLNVDGMLPFENMIADYVKETENHVMYRVTPVFEGDNLLASGVLLEAQSVEDQGEDIQFCVYAYNVQPGVTIDYATGANSREEPEPEAEPEPQGTDYILNVNTKKFHYPSCASVGQMKESNKRAYTGSRDEVIAQGYEPCKECNP